MKKNESLRVDQLQQRAKTISGFTHDMKNHLAVMRESNGLFDDLLMMHQLPPEELRDKLKDICDRMENRINMSVDMIQNLNSFAHRTDTKTSHFNIDSFMKEQLYFLERNARLNEVVLEIHGASTNESLENDAGILQFVVAKIFTNMLHNMSSNQTLFIEWKHGKKIAIVLFKVKNDSNINEIQIDATTDFGITNLNGKIETFINRDGYDGIKLEIPSMEK